MLAGRLTCILPHLANQMRELQIQRPCCPGCVWGVGAELEGVMRTAHEGGDEHRGDLDGIEAVLERLKAGFTRPPDDPALLAAKVAAMKTNSLA